MIAMRETMTILMHGDAAFAGEGIVQEDAEIERTQRLHNRWLHSACDHQQSSWLYDRSRGSPLLHLCPPMWPRCCRFRSSMSTAKTQKRLHKWSAWPWTSAASFVRDVVIDMYAYRRWGHNEADEPRFTQPIMYRAIDQRPSVRESYLDRLLKMGELTREEADAIADVVRTNSNANSKLPRRTYVPGLQTLGGYWRGLHRWHRTNGEQPPTVSRPKRYRAFFRL